MGDRERERKRERGRERERKKEQGRTPCWSFPPLLLPCSFLLPPPSPLRSISLSSSQKETEREERKRDIVTQNLALLTPLSSTFDANWGFHTGKAASESVKKLSSPFLASRQILMPRHLCENPE